MCVHNTVCHPYTTHTWLGIKRSMLKGHQILKVSCGYPIKHANNPLLVAQDEYAVVYLVNSCVNTPTTVETFNCIYKVTEHANIQHHMKPPKLF